MMYTSAFRICSETIVLLISECHGVSSLNTRLMLELVRLKLRLLQFAMGNIYIYIAVDDFDETHLVTNHDKPICPCFADLLT